MKSESAGEAPLKQLFRLAFNPLVGSSHLLRSLKTQRLRESLGYGHLWPK